MSDSKRPPDALPVLNGDDDEEGRPDTETKALRIDLVGVSAEEVLDDTLTVVSGEARGKVFSVGTEDMWIGRAPECAILVEDRGVSRRHAQVVRRAGTVMIRDNGAKNGTYVNQRRIVEQELRPGDVIELAPEVTLMFDRGKSSATGGSGPPDASSAVKESVAAMVAGMAHELNTPLGVANTANAMIASLAEEVLTTTGGERIEGLLSDLRKSTNLMSKHIQRANDLVRSFKQLSPREGSEDRSSCELDRIAQEAMGLVADEAARRQVTLRPCWSETEAFPWVGVQQHMLDVLVQLLRNALTHAYDGSAPAIVDVRIKGDASRYNVEVEDYGVGVPPEILSRIFEPFVTTGRHAGALGLGLAIVHNVVTNRFHGQITCSSRVGRGTRFTVRVPRVVPIRPQEL